MRCWAAGLACIVALCGPAHAAEPSGPVGPIGEAVAKVRWTNQPGPQSEPEGRVQRQFWQVPSPVAGQVPLKATTYRPKGPGPFPLALMMHGGITDDGKRHELGMPHFFDLAVLLIDRGYFVVAPQRRSYGDDPNPFAEQNGSCSVADFRKALGAAAADGQATIDFMRRQPFIDGTRLLIVGHSAGGATSLAMGADTPSGLTGIINFAGGKGANPTGNWRKNCHPENLLEAVRGYGARTKVPSLWIYAQNDLWVPPDYATMMHKAYNEASGGKARLLITAAYGADGHYMALQRDGAEIWRKDVTAFVDGLRPPAP